MKFGFVIEFASLVEASLLGVALVVLLRVALSVLLGVALVVLLRVALSVLLGP